MLFTPPDEYLTDEDETWGIRYALRTLRSPPRGVSAERVERVSPSYVLVARVLRDPYRRKAQGARRFISWNGRELRAVWNVLNTYMNSRDAGEGYDEGTGALMYDIRELLRF